MEKVILYGKMEEDIRDNMSMIKNRAMESLYGLMGGVTKDNGKMESKMGGEFLKTRMGYRRSEYGVMVEK
jgi:hypothetical protein